MPSVARQEDPLWLDRFHAGDARILEECYRLHVGRALAAASRILNDVDAETVTHEVFYRLLSDAGMRRSFSGGNLGAWIAQVATHAAIDVHRRKRREVGENALDHAAHVDPARQEAEVEARLLIERFRRGHLPEKWQSVFEARFIRQLPQREAARELGIQRSTLAYQEQQVRELLTAFLLAAEGT